MSKAKKNKKLNANLENESIQNAEYVKTIEDSQPEEPMMSNFESHQEPAAEKLKIQFYGSEMLREKAPHAFEFAEAVAEDWAKDGDFKALPLKNPWAQMAASQGFQKVKQVEKKLDELGVIPMAKMGYELIKAKLKK